MDNILREATKDYLRKDQLQFRPGDRIAIDVKVVEGNRTRVQTFEGDVIAMSGSGINRTFTVRKISEGVGVERRLFTPGYPVVCAAGEEDISIPPDHPSQPVCGRPERYPGALPIGAYRGNSVDELPIDGGPGLDRFGITLHSVR